MNNNEHKLNTSIEDIYGNNPLITQLPPILDTKSVIKHLRGKLKFIPEQRFLPQPERIHLIAQLPHDFFQPLTKHLSLEQKISIMIRQGYVSRNITNGDRQRHLNAAFQQLELSNESSYRYAPPESTATSMSIIGCSGSGKTTTINKILRYYPQVIEHRELGLKQIVYLKIDCPHDSSLKNLCSNFFRAVDLALGDTNFEHRFTRSRLNVNAMLQQMKIIANNYSIGLLIIDEIQHLNTKKSGGAEIILNFFVTLVNVASIPIVMIGTPKANEILQEDLRSARRSAGLGSLIWEPMRNEVPTPDPSTTDQMIISEWYAFTNKLWQYQWVQQPTELTDELRTTWYYFTQGIPDLVVKLFCLVQIHAITIGLEKITSELFKKVYEEQLQPVHDILDALRSGNPTRIARYSDLTIPQVQIEKYIEQHHVKAVLKTEKQHKDLGPHYSVLIGMLTTLGHSAATIESHVTSTLKKYPNENLQVLLQHILEVLDNSVVIDKVGQSQSTTTVRKPRKSRKVMKAEEWKNTEANDLRNFFSQAQEQEVDVYELLKSSHYLFDPTCPVLH
ncbi:AAA family ATPase [Acinetobacter sp. CFCC 11171]|uniref:AAA family ATPase n=1 Tax=Acinetobacter sp. CFCC 11171 TaxID=1775558 RepID=UPI000DCFB7F0|nr:AAA family ATPase [Acinetobacter sp. CFCC 11171]